MFNLTSNQAEISKNSDESISLKKEERPKKASSNSNIKLCKDVLISLVYKHFGDEKPSLKNGGKQKWNEIAKEYNALVKGALEKESPNSLNAKWRNIIYKAKLMKEPYPLSDPCKPILSDNLLQDRIKELKSDFPNEASTKESGSEQKQEFSMPNDLERNTISREDDNRMCLSNLKKQIGIGLFFFNFISLRTLSH